MTRDVIVQTRLGTVRGEEIGGVRRFLGLPYAAAKRFAAPQPIEAWSGTHDARSFGNRCPERLNGKPRPSQITGKGYGEDCLNLNLWMPTQGAPGPKPVLLWIHGGAFVSGTGASYDGQALAQEGDICVVTINYRLGALGFVNFGEALGLPEIPSNLGLRDQIAALEWVRDNIADYGGDPANVTISGESAGSMSVSMLMLCQPAWPLFHAGIMMSGATSMVQDRELSLTMARRYAELLHLNEGSLERLQTMEVIELFRVQAQVDAEFPGILPVSPWFDDDLLPASLDVAREAQTAPVPLIAGAMLEEIRFFELAPGSVLPTSWESLRSLIYAHAPRDRAEAILACYPVDKAGRRALATDLTFAMPTRNFAHRQAREQACWCYRFDYAHPIVGAAHALDLTLLWPFSGLLMAVVRGGPNTGRRAALGRRLRRHFAHFARHHRAGDDWPPYDHETRSVRIFNLVDDVVLDPEPARFAAWAGHDVPVSFEG